MATANMKDVKRRIKSVESTMQITKAMQLVASSKLRKAKKRAEDTEPFFNSLYETMCDICRDSAFDSIYMRKQKDTKNSIIVVIAGDRGLAGGYNSNVLKTAAMRCDELKENGTVKVVPIGKKAVEYFEKRNYEILTPYQHIAETLSIYDAIEIAEEIVDSFNKSETDNVELFYTTFVSALVQEPRTMKVLPVELLKDDEKQVSATIYEPSPETVFNGLIPRYISGILYGAIVESFASEQASRRTAMESASDNATEMIDNLSLQYNRARQATITQEITEIVSGAQLNN